MKNIKMLDLPGQYHSIHDEIETAIYEVIHSGNYILGPFVDKFEREIAEYLGIKHAVGVASGSDALILSLCALGIGPGDKVIVPSFTFFATAGAVVRAGATPVFVDINPQNYLFDAQQTINMIESDPTIRAVIPVHLFGLPAELAALQEHTTKNHVFIVEDACQAIGGEFTNRSKCGSIGDTGCFSFFPSKNLGCFGDGGLITTNNDEIAAKLRILRTHGSSPKYYHKIVGFNSRLDALQAAILSVKLKHLPVWLESRRLVALRYNELFSQLIPTEYITLPTILPGHTVHQYTIRVAKEKRPALVKYLQTKGISSAIYYPLPLHLQECFSNLDYKSGNLIHSELAADEVISLPIDPALSEEDIQYIVRCLAEFFLS